MGRRWPITVLWHALHEGVQGPGSNEIEQSYWMRAINWMDGL
jgi:hypothetical protein